MSRHTLSQGLLLSISVIALSACSGGQPQGIEAHKSAAPTPPVSLVDGPVDTLTPVVAANTTTTVTTTVPGADASIEARMEKLEHAVGSLRTDYDRIMPAFASLNTTNERIQTLLDEIEDQNGQPMTVKSEKVQTTTPTTVSTTTVKTTEIVTPSPEVMKAMDDMAPAATARPVAAMVPQAVKAAPKVAGAITSSVKGVRIGEHGNKTRLVIDLGTSGKPDMKYDVDNTEKLLLVDLPASGWDGAKTGAPKASAYVTSWSVQDGSNGGSSLAIQLKKSAKVLSTEYLKAEGKDPARLVIDIGPAA